MGNNLYRLLTGITAISLLALAACGGPEPTTTPTSTSTPGPVPARYTTTPSPTTSPTPTPIPPTRTPTPTRTASSTPSPLPPTASHTPSPLPTPTIPPTATPTPQPTPVALVMDIPLGLEPQDVAIAGGFVWVAHADGEVRVLTPEGMLLTTVHTDGGAVALTTDGVRLWVAHRNGAVTEIDARSGALTARWTVPCTTCLVRGIHWDGAALWASNFAEDTLVHIDVQTGAMSTFPAGSGSPTLLASDAGGLLVLHQSLAGQSVVLTRHDPASGELLGGVEATAFPTAMLAQGSDLWLALRGEATSTLVHYDLPSLAETWRVEAAPINDLLLAGGSLWSADFADDTVTRRDPATGDVLEVYPVGDLPQALAYQDGLLWVVNRRAGTLTRLWVRP